MVTTANIMAGYIGNASGGFFIDLDNGIYRMPTTMTVGGSTVQSIADGAAGSAESAAKSYADSKDASTLSSAKSYTDSKASSTLSQADINAQAIADALDASLDQQEVIDRLLGTSQGIAVDPETGDLYISGTLIKAGTIDAALIKAGILTDAAGKNYWNMVTGYLNTTYGKIGGFDITSSAIYHTLTSLTQASTAGVYVGTDGIATANSTERMVFSNGQLNGYWGNKNMAAIGVTVGGLQLLSPYEMILRTPSISVSKNTTGSTLNTADFDAEFDVFTSYSDTNNIIKFTLSKVILQHTLGFLTSGSVSTDDFAKNVEIPTKAYVDNKAVNLKLGSDAKQNLTFNLSGTTLRITVS
jgi:hypothetical protein